MLSLRSLWSRHKRKLLISLGVLGSGYALYKLYDAHRQRTFDLEKEREVDELIKAQLQSHFENIQRVSDTVTLPYSMNYLRVRISEDLDLSHLTEKLLQGRGRSSALSPKEKIELWEKLKVLSFTRTVASLWSMTMLCLYVRVQVNILGRHLYLEIARGSESSQSLDDADSFSWHGQQDFLATADYLSTYGIGTLLTNMQNAAMEILKEKKLKESFGKEQLHDTIIQVLDLFMNAGEPSSWISYLVPENAAAYRQLMVVPSSGSDDSSMLMDISKLEQLMLETRAVLSSPDFKNVADISLRRVVDALVEDVIVHFGGATDPSSSSGVPLAKTLPRVAQMGALLLEEPSINKYVQSIRSLPEFQHFYTLLYSNMPLEF
ncbi:peroxisome biogenesis protein 3-1-like [Asparagus officinalis]|uniref:peroxisome biogenesis protein 3-1-like n=1 Tax=Asparagus officinalis TaxID=4686 RepID=UPI00098E0EF6|nr:peroxisome biogenesis protein 3-1-like [Asparagus officinalis]